MATVTNRTGSLPRAENQQRTTHPLRCLRNYIRAYVALEAAALVAIFLAGWFWIGLVLDFGVFKLTALDWVQVLPMSARALLLVVPLVGLVALIVSRMAMRLLRDFSPAALALVLERRYFKSLGDRLITAVELADPRLVDKYGYSHDMVDITIQEAADRVDQLVVHEVFDWRRLYRLGCYALVTTFGTYALVGAVCCFMGCLVINKDPESPREHVVGSFVREFNDAATIWFERNILLFNTLWPRQALIEVLDIPDNGELRVGTTADAPTIRVRYYRWVIAERDRQKAPEGWRPLLWTDLGRLVAYVPDPSLLGMPPSWRGTVDEVEQRVRELAAAGDDDRLSRFDSLLQELTACSRSPQMSRKLRRLPKLQRVSINFTGRNDVTTIEGNDEDDYDKPRTFSEAKSAWQESMQNADAQEFTATLRRDIKEEIVQFSVTALDCATPSRRIRFLPSPIVKSIHLIEDAPAYIYHRPAQGRDWESLRGLLQPLHGSDGKGRPLSTTGETTRCEVASGTRVVALFTTDQSLAEESVSVVDKRGLAKVTPLITGSRTFQITFEKVTESLDLNVCMRSRYGVTGARQLMIRATDDLSPDIDAQIETIRKTPQGYLCTRLARIPLSGKIRDDRGLSRVRMNYSYAKGDPILAMKARSSLFASIVPSGFGGFGSSMTALFSCTRSQKKDDELRHGTQDVPSFQAELKRLDELAVPDSVLTARLSMNLDDKEHRDHRDTLLGRQVKLLQLQNDYTNGDFFDVEKLDLRMPEDAVDTSYQTKLWLTARDNNVASGPGMAGSKERFTIMVVSERALLSEIFKEQDANIARLREVAKLLGEARSRCENIVADEPGVENPQGTKIIRVQQVRESIGKSREDVTAVVRDLRRIVEEMNANRIRSDVLAESRDGCLKPLQSTLDAEFQRTVEACDTLLRAVQDKAAIDKPAADTARQLTLLVARIDSVIDRMDSATSWQKVRDRGQTLIKNMERIKVELKKLYQDAIDEWFK